MVITKQKISLFILGLVLISTGLSSITYAASSSKSTSSSSSKSTSTNTAASTSTKSTTTDLSSGVTQSYAADPSVQIGMLVQLDLKHKGVVIPLAGDIKNMLGVIVPNNEASIVLTPASGATQQQVLVNTGGELNVIVSDQNGPIKAGDYLSLSSLPGIAMKAGATQDLTIGRAEAAFDGKTNVIGTVQTKNSLKKDVTINYGRIIVSVGITHNPTFNKSRNDYVPGFIGKIVFQITSKQVSAARVYFALALLIGLIVVVANMIYGGVRGTMVSLGRNPLARKTLLPGLFLTILISIGIFGAGVMGIFVFLKL